LTDTQSTDLNNNRFPYTSKNLSWMASGIKKLPGQQLCHCYWRFWATIVINHALTAFYFVLKLPVYDQLPRFHVFLAKP